MSPHATLVLSRVLRTVLVLAAVFPLFGTTLERLTLDEIAARSTTIVRGRISGCAGEMRTSVVYTRCEVSVSETWKGGGLVSTVVYIPGGTAGRVSQTFSGTPVLAPGEEYVLFLWAGASGRNQLIGLTQGVYAVQQDAKTGEIAVRGAASVPMVDRSGSAVEDIGAKNLSVRELKRRVTAALVKEGR